MYDLLVIGAGPGGYPSAIFAAESGMKVCVVEKAQLGGVCLNWGCIPTKSLLKAAEHIFHIRHAKEWGISVENMQIDIASMVKQSRQTVTQLTGGIEYLFKTHKIDLIKNEASIGKISHDCIEVLCGNELKKAKSIIIATGASARQLPGAAFSKRVWGAPQAMTPDFLPDKIAIIGAGAIGIEFANFYSTLGSQVTIFEATERILRGVDLELAKFMEKTMSKQTVQFKIGQKIEKIEETSTCVKITVGGQTQSFDCIIVAIGVVPNSQNFPQLEKENGYIKTNEYHQTYSNSKLLTNVFAIGDCCAPPWLAHKATHEGLRAVRYILGQKLKPLQNVPLCIYTNPQIASIGKTQEELEEQYGKEFDHEVLIAKAYFKANGKAVASKEADGFVKMLFSKKTGEMLGAHMIGPCTTELIHSAALGMQLEALPQDWVETIFPHPTLSEAMYEAILAMQHG